MKDITKYFVDAVKPSENMTINANGNSKEVTDSDKAPTGKRNRVKIKISKRSTEERVCDIIESNNDMIDKTPSPFAKVNNKDKNSHDGTPRRSSVSKLAQQISHNKLQSQQVDKNSVIDVSSKSISNLNVKRKRRKGKSNSENDMDEGIEYKKKSNDKSHATSDTSLNGPCNSEKNPEVKDISNDDFNNEDDNREESNAFQILMSRNKTIQHVSPTPMSPQDEGLNTRKSEEYKEKLKRSKEKLIALADKKGYSKRKLAEMEEGEKIERTIQNRIKSFKGEDKKDNSIGTNVTSQKQSSSNLLNYFSKTSLDLTPKNMAKMSTLVVKADVHMSEDSVICSSHKLNSNNGRRSSEKSRKSCVEFSQVDDISVIASENIDVSHDQQEKHAQQQRNKHRWSLRIKLQTSEDKDSLPDVSSDEELFSPRSKTKLNTERSRKNENKYTDSDVTDPLIKNKKSVKELNGHRKLKLKRNEQRKSSESQQKNIVISDSDNLKTKSQNSCNEAKIYSNEGCKLTDSEKHRSTLTQNKNLKHTANTNSTNVSKIETNLEDCVIISHNSFKRKSNEKLAPLFTKRRKPDPETVAARRLFLQSDKADNDSKSTDRRVNICGALPFPCISHITQLNDSNFDEPNNFNIPTKMKSQYVPVLNISNYKHVLDLTKINSKALKSINKPNIQEVLTEIEVHCSDARKMWNTISLTFKGHSSKVSSPKTRAKRGKLSGKKEMIENKSNDNQAENSIWIYKYKPMSTEEIVGNEEAAVKLKEWLNGWRATLTNEAASSGDEFYSSDCSYSTSNENNQVAILLGPHGSGKTASVYAIAEELGYTVLEVNASSRRTGKKLLKELEEATKSHRIKKDKGVSALFNTVSDETVPKKIPQNSLILLEDVDLIFEEDEGFVSAAYQLASNTKRPIVMTCRDVCPHLSKIAPQQNRIYFQSAVGVRVSALLQLISLAETGYRLSHACIAELLQTGDLRKALLQLQYLLLSGPPQILQESIVIKNSLWQNMRYCLYKPAIKANRKRKAKKNTNNDKTTDNTMDVLNNVASKLDNIALLSTLIIVEDCALNLSHVKVQPSLSLNEDTVPYSVSHSISSEIADWIGEKTMRKEQLNEPDGAHSQNGIVLKRHLNKGVNLALSNATSLLLDHRTMSVDYLPSIRAICRAEEFRANINNKRGNRFFHYLHGLKVPTASLRPNILAAACKMMHDKVDDGVDANENNPNVL